MTGTASTRKQKKRTSSIALFLYVAVIAVGTFLAYSHRHWTSTNAVLVQKLYAEDGVIEESPEVQKRRFDHLPAVVKRYFKTVLPELHDAKRRDLRFVRKIKSVRMDQKGTFLLNKRWISFHAEQHISAVMSNIGFLWDATMFLSSPTPQLPGVGLPKLSAEIPIKVRDAHVKGVGTMEALLLAFLPLMKVEDTAELNEGELMRWLAEAVLVPTALLPSKGGEITWTAHSEDATWATLQLNDSKHGGKASVDVHFDENGFITSVKGMRPKKVHDKFVSNPWEGHLSDYKEFGGMLIPTKMEAGWRDGNELNLYFKAENTDFDYEFVEFQASDI